MIDWATLGSAPSPGFGNSRWETIFGAFGNEFVCSKVDSFAGLLLNWSWINYDFCGFSWVGTTLIEKFLW